MVQSIYKNSRDQGRQSDEKLWQGPLTDLVIRATQFQQGCSGLAAQGEEWVGVWVFTDIQKD